MTSKSETYEEYLARIKAEKAAGAPKPRGATKKSPPKGDAAPKADPAE